MNSRGFTLIELLITIAIIGILAAVSVTAYIGTTLKAARTEAYTQLASLRLLEERYRQENNAYAPAESTNMTSGDHTIAPLPAFQPGRNRMFDYAIKPDVALPASVSLPYDGTEVASPPPCFIATATGITNSKVDGDVFAIDCNNNTNY